MKHTNLLMITASLFFLFGCEKGFLDAKRDKRQVIPVTVQDLQALLDDATRTMNSNSCNELGLIGSAEYFITDDSWNRFPASALPYEKLGYIWTTVDVYEGKQVRDWDYAYRRILFANTAIAGIEKIDASSEDQEKWRNVKGSALFFRGYNFYQLAQTFCAAYDAGEAESKPGIPLRLEPDITLKTPRSSVAETYRQIIHDISQSIPYLPVKPLLKYRPSKPAAYAMLAKTHLLMGNYREAKLYADSCLQIRSELLDFNKLNLNLAYSLPVNMEENPEIIFITNILNIPMFQVSRLRIPLGIYNAYEDADLGKGVYFIKNADATISFKGSYYGSRVPLFTGIAVDELYLVRAECHARLGETIAAAKDLNDLLKNRYETAGFKPLIFATAQQALDIIIEQRIKRLILRGTKWEDLRRLNKEARYAKTLTRNLNGINYELPPGDNRYVWPIPDKAVELGGYTQNPR